MNRKELAPVALAAWLTIVAAFMLLLRRFDLEIFFVLALIGILVIAELMQYRYVRPRYQRGLTLLIAAGIAVFCLIVVQKVLEILAP